MFEDEQFLGFASLTVKLLEGLGIVALMVGVVISLIVAARNALRRERHILDALRRHLGRSILLGLEFLIAGDIVRTVAVEQSLENVAVLALIVLVRTALSFVLEVEITGRWPWQQATAQKESPGARPPSVMTDRPDA
jgi:uncharacterized membrane protein